MGKEITTEKALDLFEKIIEIKTDNKMLKEMNYDYVKEIERLKGCLSDKEGLIYSMGEEINKLKEVHLPDVSSRFCIGEYIRIKRDTTKFLKENNYWLEEYDLAGINNIDGMTGIIKGDYTDLKGDESHYVVALVNIDMSGIGIHPDYIMTI